ncbi:Ig-like domain-containing protein [Archangium lansingense]|uniref:Ig-like domain-containing protein n=1 Tax=Archangium lansingense TaxID=2995310 RepID=UPI003B7B981E
MPTLKRYIPLVLAGLMSACLELPEIDTSPPATPPQPDAGAVDAVRPSITRSIPANGSTNVALNAALELEFSEPMNVDTVQVSISPEAVLGEPVWSAESTRLVLLPSANLAQNTPYTLMLNGRDEEGNDLTGTRIITFSTTGPAPDTTAPNSLGFVPGNQTTGVETRASITVLFSEPMEKNSVQGAFSITSPVGFNSGTFTWNDAGTEVNFKPNMDFGHGVDVAWRISTSAKDQAGNILQEAITGTFRTIQTKTITIDFDPTTSGGLGTPNYFRGSSIYNFEIVGDSSGNGTYRLFIGFRLDALPESTTEITHATLKWWISGKQGDPFKKFGNLLLEQVNIGDRLDYTTAEESVDPAAIADYNSTPLSDAIIAPIDITSTQGRFEITPFIVKDWANRSTRSKRSQFRLRFESGSDADNTNDMLFSDAETQPKLAELEVTYAYP